ncbi:MAG: hypothetical protein JOZ94_23490 [Xanthobacteraceae bacterium]|nr:hypothetical protein [Xanthobacteraceae bacterium]MBV9632784.1 hypothetical protein [Xanthobacteraceae bacterium]
MSRQLLRRLLAIVAAYILALQPIARVTMLHGWDGAAQLCSSAEDGTAPPIGHEHEHACCLGTCCPGLFGPISPPAVAFQARPAAQQFQLLETQVCARPKARHAQSRAPPVWPT